MALPTDDLKDTIREAIGSTAHGTALAICQSIGAEGEASKIATVCKERAQAEFDQNSDIDDVLALWLAVLDARFAAHE